MANIVKELLDSLHIGKVFLTGHSLGGYVTLAFLELFPDSLLGYCLFHSQPFPDTPETIEKRKREIALVKEGKKELFYPDNITRMFAGSNLELFPGALRRSQEIAGGLKDETIIAVLKRNDGKAVATCSDGGRQGPVLMDTWLQWTIIYHAMQYRKESSFPQMQHLLSLKSQGIWGLLRKRRIL